MAINYGCLVVRSPVETVLLHAVLDEVSQLVVGDTSDEFCVGVSHIPFYNIIRMLRVVRPW